MPTEPPSPLQPSSHPALPSPEGEPLGFDLPEPARPTRLRVGLLLAVVTSMALAAFFAAWLPRRKAQQELSAGSKTALTALPRVQVISPKPKTSDHALALPGSIQPLEETTVYPRASGYVRKWHVDIGDHVQQGDLLVDIDTPEVDQQLSQARAQLAQSEASLLQAQANQNLSATSLARYQELAPKGIASQQELDQHRAQSVVDGANVKVAQAAIDAQRANVRRLVETKSFARVSAPFAGTVNTRTVERGALVSPTTPLFTLSTVDPVRVFVRVPQDVATSIHPGLPAPVSLREYRGRLFEGTIARTAGALDPATRTMTTEVRVPNPKGELLAGMYVQVMLTLPTPRGVLEIPATAMMNDAKGLRVATVTSDGRLKMRPVVVERDNGATIDVASGIEATDRVVKLAGAELADDMMVEVASP